VDLADVVCICRLISLSREPTVLAYNLEELAVSANLGR
jgi:hypothetical protein